MSFFKAAVLFFPIGLGLAGVNAQETSAVQEAAKERVKDKMGNLRGGLNEDSSRVFLTEEMIELRKPVDQRKPAKRDLEDAQQDISTADLLIEGDFSDPKLMDEISETADAVIAAD